ncbi:hypothetical protein A3A67_04550 [Candidatus Peribacteria bacterium RIFCSPLOWO2_01_FULL_51_18]|nr:MAG: hypothetical protein A3C52_03305 [Candidatus Peribacteria bacterium RIFCSPHIGHO2_02_FULL_51_15]OGJ66679.1 MAG: hypothetical protein A3A67_04550 [Candidatus Peribacteria bacterium RIFCSPLOWO2_01_FULL_51_18]OGJ69783.1 MAG: hypothetical protein A3J34_04870 [Candidatus Peribacteria bacterium RIFCSPLOWO2_02_FULL_51_10]
MSCRGKGVKSKYAGKNILNKCLLIPQPGRRVPVLSEIIRISPQRWFAYPRAVLFGITPG